MHIYTYIYIWKPKTVKYISPICMLKLLTLAARHPYCTPVQRRFALDGYRNVRALARTQPVANVTHWLPCEAVHSASDLSRRSHLLPLKLRGPHGVECVPA